MTGQCLSGPLRLQRESQVELSVCGKARSQSKVTFGKVVCLCSCFDNT